MSLVNGTKQCFSSGKCSMNCSLYWDNTFSFMLIKQEPPPPANLCFLRFLFFLCPQGFQVLLIISQLPLGQTSLSCTPTFLVIMIIMTPWLLELKYCHQPYFGLHPFISIGISRQSSALSSSISSLIFSGKPLLLS